MTRLLGIAALVVTLGLAQGVAHAALWLELTPSTAPRGAIVHAKTLGKRALATKRALSLPTFLVDSEVKRIQDPDDARLVRIGDLRVNESGDGSLTFRVPDLPPGAYTVMVHCQVCAPFSAGREILPAGEFVIEPGPPVASPPQPRGDSGTYWWIVPVLVLALALALLALSVSARRRLSSGS